MLLLLLLSVLSLLSPITQGYALSPSGSDIAIATFFRNGTAFVGEVNVRSGDVTHLTRIPDGGSYLLHIYSAASTVDHVGNVYYACIVSSSAVGEAAGMMLSYDYDTSTLLNYAILPDLVIFYTLGYDPADGYIYGLSNDMHGDSESPTLYRVDTQQFSIEKLSEYPSGYFPVDNGGSYNVKTHTMSAFVASPKDPGSHVFSQSIVPGGTIEKVLLESPPLHYTFFVDFLRRRYLSLARNATAVERQGGREVEKRFGTHSLFYLAEVDIMTGATTALGEGLLGGSYDPTANSYSSELNQYLCLFSNSDDVVLVVLDGTDGSVLSQLFPWEYGNNWTSVPVNFSLV